jgi:PIN domain nuclease of toxin-antitoxin system
MKLLLDTHTFLWVLTDDPALSKPARERILAADNEVWVSAASAWEIAIKFGLGKLPLPEEPDRYLPRVREASGIELLPIGEASDQPSRSARTASQKLRTQLGKAADTPLASATSSASRSLRRIGS